MNKSEEVKSPYLKGPAYRYLRVSDKLPVQSDSRARVKLFDPTGSWTWFISSFDPETGIAYGRVHGFEDEYGDIYIPELVEYRGRFGLPIERDLHWTPQPLKECNR